MNQSNDLYTKEKGDKVSVSVIIATHNPNGELLSCLSAFKGLKLNAHLSSLEIIVVGYISKRLKNIISEQYEGVTVISTQEYRSVPELRALGIKAARNDVIALLEDHCLPDAEWLNSIIDGAISGNLVVGGAIDYAGGSRLVDWAVYFVEYSAFMSPLDSGIVERLPGNNVSYSRAAISLFEDLLDNSAWESVWHERLREKGITLFCNPAMIVYHKREFKLLEFLRLFFIHGRNHGALRHFKSGLYRMMWLLGGFATPFLMALRTGENVFRKGRSFGSFIKAFPLVVVFYYAWTLGEVIGTLTGRMAMETGWNDGKAGGIDA